LDARTVVIVAVTVATAQPSIEVIVVVVISRLRAHACASANCARTNVTIASRVRRVVCARREFVACVRESRARM
jgi:hypothetical protein